MTKSNILILSLLITLFYTGCAFKTPLIEASASGDSSAVEELIRSGADVNQPDSRQYTPLMHAVWSRNNEIIKTLLQKGADINKRDKTGYTALHWAINYGYLDTAEILIDKGADINAKDNYGGSPLHLAVSNRNVEAVKYLKRKSANYNSKDSYGETPVTLAKYNNDNEIIRILNPKYGESIRIAIITDACVYEENFLEDTSMSVKKLMASASKENLDKQGYYKEVVVSDHVYTCSYMKDSKDRLRNVVDDYNLSLKPYDAAILYLLRYTASTVKPQNIKESNNETIYNITDSQLLTQLNIIKKKGNASHVLVLVGNAKIVPLSKQVVQGVAIGAITAALTLGHFVYSTWPVSAMQTSLLLIDLDRNKLLWSDSILIKGGGFTENKYYSSGEWHNNVLTPVSSYIE